MQSKISFADSVVGIITFSVCWNEDREEEAAVLNSPAGNDQRQTWRIEEQIYEKCWRK